MFLVVVVALGVVVDSKSRKFFLGGSLGGQRGGRYVGAHDGSEPLVLAKAKGQYSTHDDEQERLLDL